MAGPLKLARKSASLSDVTTGLFGLTTSSCLFLLAFHIEDGQVGKVPVFLLIIKPVSDHVFIGDLEADVIERHVDRSPLRLTQ
jgi:hypothetical protein